MKRILVSISLALMPLVVNAPQHGLRFYTKDALNCQATNIYHEARGEPLESQVLVARSVINRAKSIEGICAQVFKPKQYSWTLSRSKRRQKLDLTNYYLPAHLALNYNSSTVTHYHALVVKPAWARKLQKLETINNHIYYGTK